MRSAKDLEGYTVAASDGDIGTVKDYYFDDVSWTVRYLVVDTGEWLPGRRVLLPPPALGQANPAVQKLFVNLTRAQVRNSPDIDTHKPVSRQHEMDLYQYYGWTGYWLGDPLVAPAAVPLASAVPRSEEQNDPHLQSANQVKGYGIHASDGDIGHVDDFLIDDESWEIRYLVVDTGHWLSGKKMLVSPRWAENISWEEHKIYLHLARGTIQSSPEFDPSVPVTREYEHLLHEHYGVPAYWR